MLISLAISLEVIGIGYGAFDVWVLGHWDPKWGGPAGTFQLSVQILQYVVLSAVVGAVPMMALFHRRLRGLSRGGAIAVSSLLGAIVYLSVELGLARALSSLAPNIVAAQLLTAAVLPPLILSAAILFVATRTSSDDSGVA